MGAFNIQIDNGLSKLDFIKEEWTKIPNRKYDDEVAQRIQNKVDV